MRVAALGASAEIAGYSLAGVLLYPADDADAARSAWAALPQDIGLVILTAAANAALGESARHTGRLVAVMPV